MNDLRIFSSEPAGAEPAITECSDWSRVASSIS